MDFDTLDQIVKLAFQPPPLNREREQAYNLLAATTCLNKQDAKTYIDRCGGSDTLYRLLYEDFTGDPQQRLARLYMERDVLDRRIGIVFGEITREASLTFFLNFSPQDMTKEFEQADAEYEAAKLRHPSNHGKDT